MAPAQSRRDLLKQLGLAGIGLSIANLPELVLPALAQGETLVPFTRLARELQPEPGADRPDCSTSARSTARSRRKTSSSRRSTTAIPTSTRRPTA